MTISSDFLGNPAIVSSFIAWAIAQLIKVLIDLFKNKQLDYSLFISSGGWPSSHSSSSVALCTSIGITDGCSSSVFALSLLFAVVVMYDATGVRRAAGEQAGVINNFSDFMASLGFKSNKRLKELLGHSPIEVLSGAILGFLVALFLAK